MRPIEERQIPLLERVVMTHLIREDGRIAGAAGFRLDTEQTIIIRAKSVILCTGAGGFKPSGFPVCDLTHVGTVMAYRIGAKFTGKEWNDGHSTRSTNPAACCDNWGDMFDRVPSTNGVEVHHDLGMDINYRAYVNGNPVAGGGPPPGFAASSNVGGASAGMAIHKSEGLAPVNDRCASSIPGLYAAGDALGSHMAGGIYTQIGSSLAGSAVQCAIAGEAAADYSGSVEAPSISDARIAEVVDEILAPLAAGGGLWPGLGHTDAARGHDPQLRALHQEGFDDAGRPCLC